MIIKIYPLTQVAFGNTTVN